MMNIIISSPDNYKITETRTASIHNTRVYIATDLIDSLDLTNIVLKSADGTYHCSFVAKPDLDKANLHLNGFAIQSQEGCIPAGDYRCEIPGMTTTISIVFTEGLVDEHAPIYIRDRSIGKIETSVVEGDKNSQQFVFYIQRCYDGVSFLNPSKNIYVDYIPVDTSYLVDEEGQPVAFLSDLLIVEDTNPEPDLNGRDWVKLIWNLPPEATAKQGTVTFAISVQGYEQEEDYLWQTLPSSFMVLSNIGKRPPVPVSSSDGLGVINQLQQQVNELETDVRNLESLDRDGDPDNANFIIGGGGAEEYFELEEV